MDVPDTMVRFLASVASIITAAGAWASSCIGLKRTHKRILELHLAINTRMDQLIKSERKDATDTERRRGEDERKVDGNGK